MDDCSLFIFQVCLSLDCIFTWHRPAASAERLQLPWSGRAERPEQTSQTQLIQRSRQ